MNRQTTNPRNPPAFSRRLALLLLLAGAFSLSRPLLAQTTAPADVEVSMPATQPSPAVVDLIRQLGDDSFSVRDAAQQKLAAMDPSIEGQLRGAIAAGLPPEARSRAQALADQFRDQRYFGGSRITIHAKDAPLSDVLKSFTAQARVPLGTDDPAFAAAIADRHVTIDLDHADFWTALKQLADAGNMGLSLGQSQSLRFRANRLPAPVDGDLVPAFTGLAASFGPLRIVPISGVRGEVVLHIYAEPKIRPVPLAGALILQSCLDDLGASHRQAQQITDPAMGPWSWTQICMTDAPDNKATKLTLFKAEYRLVLETNHQTFDFVDLATKAAQTHAFDTGTFTVSQLTGDATSQHVTVTATMNNARATTITMGNGKVSFGIPPCSISLLDDKGAPLSPQFSMRNTVPTLSITFTAPTAKKASIVRCDVAGLQRTIALPIEFHDVPLPPPVILP